MSYPGNPLGWKAQLDLGFKNTPARTVLAHRTQSGPLTVQRPFYPEGDVCHIYLLHPPGGVVGGDALQINVNLEDEAKVLVTTPGATKFYRSNGKLSSQSQVLKVAEHCALEWFPQENIFFDQTQTHLSTRIELSDTARFMGWEINCYGRPASELLFQEGQVRTSLEIFLDGDPIFLDKLIIADLNALASPVSLNNFPCMGTFIATHVSKDLLAKVRESSLNFNQQGMIGITLMDELLIVRCLSQYAEPIANQLKAIWSLLRPDVLHKQACKPRIWST